MAPKTSTRSSTEQVRPWLDEADNRRAFVIISDAMRYEIAEELTGYLNGTYRVQAELSSQLGVLPSYTALGMASLLPHSKLEYTEKGDDPGRRDADGISRTAQRDPRALGAAWP